MTRCITCDLYSYVRMKKLSSRKSPLLIFSSLSPSTLAICIIIPLRLYTLFTKYRENL